MNEDTNCYIEAENTKAALSDIANWQERYTGLPVSYIENIENAKINELKEISNKLDELNATNQSTLEVLGVINLQIGKIITGLSAAIAIGFVALGIKALSSIL